MYYVLVIPECHIHSSRTTFIHNQNTSYSTRSQHPLRRSLDLCYGRGAGAAGGVLYRVPGTVLSEASSIGALDPSNEARSAPALLAPAGSKLAAAQSRDLPSARAATAATSYCAYTNCEAHDRHVVSPNASATQPRHRGVAKPI